MVTLIVIEEVITLKPERYWRISETQLKQWLKALDDEPSIEGDGIDTIQKEIDLILEAIDDKYQLENKQAQERPLQMSDIIIGKEYAVAKQFEVKNVFHGVHVKITSKARTKITGELLQKAGVHPAGKKFTFYPSNLVEV